MSSRSPVLRQISWIATISQLIAIALCVGIGGYFGQSRGVMIGALIYLVHSRATRWMILSYHYQGMSQVRSQRFDEAIASFKQSLRFLDRHDWIDRHRSIVLMTPSAAGFREFALIHIGYCYAQIGDGDRARASYETCLERFPDSQMAAVSLRMLEAAQS